MGGRQRLPIEVVQARGFKHLTKAEIQERQEREIKPGETKTFTITINF